MTNSLLLHYDCLAAFKRIYYKDLLTSEHLSSSQVKINKLAFPDGSEDDEANFWGYIFEKDNVKYLLSSIDKFGKEINLKEFLPIRADDLLKVASKGIVYYWIRKPVSMRFRSEKTMTFKELLHRLALFRHSNPSQQLLNWFFGLTQIMDRANFRVATPPGFGKDSTVDILGNLLGNAGTIENPTVAKLEERASCLKWLAINEVVDITKAHWRDIEQVLLSMGAFKPVVTKRSKKHGTVGETIDISDFSLTLMYNDVNCYPNTKRYFDFVSKQAVIDRFPAFRLYGTFDEDFNNIKDVDIDKFVTEHMDEYKELIYNLKYYQEHKFSLLNNYDKSKLQPLPERWSTNIGRLLNIIDLYCENQDEFDSWIWIINESLKDYKDMLKYPKLYMAVLKEMEKKIPNATKLRRSVKHFNRGLAAFKTFTEKNAFIKGYKIITDVKNTKGDFWNDD